MDICCGRGKGFFSHPGNKLFQQVIRQCAQRYEASNSKHIKSQVVSSVVEGLAANGCRFVKKDGPSGRWFVLTRLLSHEKTGHAIRDHIIQRKKLERTNSSNQEQHSSSAVKKQRAQKKKTYLHEDIGIQPQLIKSISVDSITVSGDFKNVSGDKHQQHKNQTPFSHKSPSKNATISLQMASLMEKEPLLTKGLNKLLVQNVHDPLLCPEVVSVASLCEHELDLFEDFEILADESPNDQHPLVASFLG